MRVVLCLMAMGLLFVAGSLQGLAAGSDDSVLSAEPLRLDHRPWDSVLRETVLRVGRSAERLSRAAPARYIDSNITYGNQNPSRYENNRVLFHLLEPEHIAYIRHYREGLEALPDRLPLDRLPKAERLAYWFNLYNAYMLETLAERYPVRRLRRLLDDGGELLENKALHVDGEELSPRDIELKVYNEFRDPLVLYGFYRGAVGGPRLPNRAYTGENVWRILENNATEFVNANRGVRPDGTVLRVSRVYDWGRAAYGGSTERLRAHLEAFADPERVPDIANAEEVRTDLYDWHIADLLDGTFRQGRWSNAASLLSSPSIQQNMGLVDKAAMTRLLGGGLPPQAMELLRGIVETTEPDWRPSVLIEECPADGCSQSSSLD